MNHHLRPVSHGTVYMTLLAVMVFAVAPPAGIWLFVIPVMMHRANKKRIRAAQAARRRVLVEKHERARIAAYKSLP